MQNIRLNTNKKLYPILLIIGLLLFLLPDNSYAQEIDVDAEAAIIVDVNTGKILYAKNESTALPPASMTKMMTEYIVLEKINNGELNWDDETDISDFVYEISGNNSFSGIGLRQDKKYTVKELYYAMAINSDNGTSIALAELISGTEGEFVKLMNQKGEELGLPHFKFVNSTGLDNESLAGKHPEGTNPDDTNLLSAISAAKLAYHLITDFPEALEISKIPSTTFDEQTILNWNWMLPHDSQNLKQFHYEGVDGLKTGHTRLAGYNFTSTAERDGRRLITVVMNTESLEKRFRETAKLLDFGFSQYEEVELFPSGYTLEESSTLPVVKGKEESVKVAMKEGITLPIKKGTESEYSIEFVFDEKMLDDNGNLVAPIEKDTKVGVAKLVHNGETKIPYIDQLDKEITVDIVTTTGVDKKNWFLLMFDAIRNFFANLF